VSHTFISISGLDRYQETLLTKSDCSLYVLFISFNTSESLFIEVINTFSKVTVLIFPKNGVYFLNKFLQVGEFTCWEKSLDVAEEVDVIRW
jgi:hypothetical protein